MAGEPIRFPVADWSRCEIVGWTIVDASYHDELDDWLDELEGIPSVPGSGYARVSIPEPERRCPPT